jgi:2-oxoglutarate ferredoxin oxidoreductase subunit delta
MVAKKADAAAGTRPKKVGGRVYIDPELCKGCGYCVHFCPTNVLEISQEFNAKGYHPPVVVNADACTGCDLCGMYCPDFCIFGVRLSRT